MKSKILFLFLIISSLAIAARLDVTALERGPISIENSSAPAVVIYPNPATHYIQLDNIQQVERLVFYNVIGQAIKYFEVAENRQYDISDLPKGIYMVGLLDRHARALRTVRISKQ